jgi:dipeptidyl aminopeptidase/acylaminoacyl peptidase
MRWRLLPLIVVACFWCDVLPARGQKDRRTHDITIEDYFTQADILESRISPDGDYVAYTQGTWQKSTNDRKTDLWVVPSRGTPQKLTFDRANDRSPQWVSGYPHIYFLGNRKRAGEKEPPFDGKTQVWRIHRDGGTPQPVTRVEGGVERFALALMNGRAFAYYVTSKELVDADFKSLRSKFKHIDYGHGVVRVSQVWKLDLQTWRSEKIIDDQRVIHEFAVAPDGKRIAMITTTDGKVVSFEGRSRVDIYHAATGKITPLPDKVFRKDVPSPYGWLEHLTWGPHGSDRLAFNVIFDAYPSEVVVALVAGNTPNVFLMKRPPGVSLHGYGSPLAWRGPGRDLCFLGDVQGRVRLFCAKGVDADQPGGFETVTPGDVVVAGFSYDKDGQSAAVLMNDITRLPDIRLYEGKGTPRWLTNANPQTAMWKLPQIKTFTWNGANGDAVEGILELPPDYQKGQRVPLVLNIHGGPTTADYLHLQYWIYGRVLLPARGYAVFCPNYRGSTGYGDKFLTDLIGKDNGIEVEDMLKGVDALVKAGIADPERLAVMGWSNGGYLTNCIISKTTRFKAAISGAGIADAVMEFAASDEPAYMIVFKKGFPWSNPAGYHRASPSYQFDKIRTPTLIHVGGDDERCPPPHSRLLYRALKEYVHVPTELLVYPGEPHGLTKYNNRLAKMEWDLAWLDRYVLGKKKEKEQNSEVSGQQR